MKLIAALSTASARASMAKDIGSKALPGGNIVGISFVHLAKYMSRFPASLHNCVQIFDVMGGKLAKSLRPRRLPSKVTIVGYPCSQDGVDEVKCVLKLPQRPKSCTLNWLLAQAQEEFVKKGVSARIAGLRTRNGSETKDSLIMDCDTPLNALRSGMELEAIFAVDDAGVDPPRVNVCLSDFEILRIIGEGASSYVLQVRKKDTKKLYAMKMMPKDRIVSTDKRTERALMERQILARTKHPFIVQMYWAFQTKKHLIFVLEFCGGGELFYHLVNLGRLDEVAAKCAL